MEKKATPYTIPQIKYRPLDLEKTGQLHKSISAKRIRKRNICREFYHALDSITDLG
jgi:hypothetical protein